MAEYCKQIIFTRNFFKLCHLSRSLKKFSCRSYSKSSEREKKSPNNELAEVTEDENEKLIQKFLRENPVPNPVRNTEKEYFDSMKDSKRRGLFETMPTHLTSWLYKDYIIDDHTELFLQHEIKVRQLLREDHKYREDRVKVLGHDLAAAHFIVHRGGAVKFVGRETWLVKNKEGQVPLPNTCIDNMHLEAVDLSNTKFTQVSAENLAPLSHLRYIRMHNCPYLDDWFLAKLHPLKDTLEFLDINNCPEITDNGLSCLHHFSNLQCLRVSNLERVKNIGLMCLLLEDRIPNLLVLGLTDDLLQPDHSQSTGERKLVRALLGFTSEKEDFIKGSIREKFESIPYLKEMYGIIKKVE
ncbi:ATP synthase subunit s-like protein [Biomphalaria pfeifferi]|uniref:ATP synthase subunit s-like protein n=1 Tax=Biomphalaria pfeifferi TaxID=112525 RepID=A0AAD8BHT7_BIOPF|nr:ATP synthase subunit s-like protein [Biomphalaria pfeifferi]